MIYYSGQILSMTECGYRQMYKSKYVLVQDLDEFVVPTRASDWSSMLDDISDPAMRDLSLIHISEPTRPY